jgi:hypothetical protein
MIDKIKHFYIYIYLFSLLLNINVLHIIDLTTNLKYLDIFLNEILIIDIFIVIFSLIFFKEIFVKIREISRLIFVKYFYLIILIGFIGIIVSLFNFLEKQNNTYFILLFYLNIFKNFVGLIIFIIIIQNKDYNLNLNIFLSLTIFLLCLSLLNFYNEGVISRFYYPFLNKTTGYNPIGLISGLIFFTTYGFLYKYNTDKVKFVIILLINFLILFFCFSKTGIISFLFVFFFYNLFIRGKISFHSILLYLVLLISLIIFLDVVKYIYSKNVFSFIDIILNPFSWFYQYGSFYYRIEHVWLSGFEKNLNLFIFLFGEGIFSPKTHDSLYFTIISRFGFLGLSLFLLFIYKVFSLNDLNKHNSLIFTLIFGLTTEMIIQSNIINPLAIILLYISCSKKINL